MASVSEGLVRVSAGMKGKGGAHASQPSLLPAKNLTVFVRIWTGVWIHGQIQPHTHSSLSPDQRVRDKQVAERQENLTFVSTAMKWVTVGLGVRRGRG